MAFLHHLFGMNESRNAYNHVYEGRGGYGPDNQSYGYEQPAHHHKSSLTHEIIAGAAGFAAMKAYEDHVRRTGEKVSHPFMKEMLAGFASAEVDKLFETKGLDYLDREKAKRRAIEQAHHIANEQYGPGGTLNYEQNQYGGGPNYYPPQGGPNYYPPQGGPNSYPPQGGPNPYPPQGAPNYYPPQGGPNPYPSQGAPNYYPPQGGPNSYPPQDSGYYDGQNEHHHGHHHHHRN